MPELRWTSDSCRLREPLGALVAHDGLQLSCRRRSVAAGQNDRKFARLTERMNRTIMRAEERCAPTQQNTLESPFNMLALEPTNDALNAATSRSHASLLSERHVIDAQRGRPAVQTAGPKKAITLSKPRTRLSDRVLEIRAVLIRTLVIPPHTQDLTSLQPPRAS